MFRTGYFGIPGSRKGSFVVHVINAQRIPLCGWHPRKGMEFQWCANEIIYEYIECRGCKKSAAKILALAKLQ